MPNFIDSTDVDAVMDSRVREDLFDDGAGYNTTAFDAACSLASTLAQSAVEKAGYLVEDDEDAPVPMLRAVALSVFVQAAYGRKSREVPPALLGVIGALAEAARVGDLPIPGISPTLDSAIGAGVALETEAVSPASAASTGAFDCLGDLW